MYQPMKYLALIPLLIASCAHPHAHTWHDAPIWQPHPAQPQNAYLEAWRLPHGNVAFFELDSKPPGEFIGYIVP